MPRNARLLLIIFIYLLADIAFANNVPPVIIKQDQKIYELDNHEEMYFDHSHQLTIKDVSSPAFEKNFIPYIYREQIKQYNVILWIRFRINNPLPHGVYIFLKSQLPNVSHGWTLYTQNKTGELVLSSLVPKPLHITMFPLTIPPHSSQIFYLSYKTESTTSRKLILQEPHTHVLETVDQYFTLGVNYGVPIALIVHSFFILLFLFDIAYLYYILFALAYLVAGVLKDGLLNSFSMITVSDWWHLHMFRLATVWIGFFHILFAKNILQAKEYVPRLNRAMNIYLISVVPFSIIALCSETYGHPFIYQIYIYAIAIYLFAGAFFALQTDLIVFSKGYKPAQYYLAGIVFLIIGYIIYFLADRNLLPDNAFTIQAPQFGLDIDIILQTTALSVRFNLIQKSAIKAKSDIIQQKRLNSELKKRAIQEQQQLIRGYSRFFPRQFLDLLGKKNVTQIKLGDQIEKSMAVLFTNISHFSFLLEKESSIKSFKFINHYLSEVEPLVRAHNGLIEKYIGDAILALFERPVEDAICAAIKIAMLIVGAAEEPIETGIGIHYGPLVVGTIGEHERMDISVIGDTVNTASRLVRLNQIYGTHIIVTGQILNELKNKEEFKIRFLDHVYVKGKKSDIKLYEVFDVDPPDRIAKKLLINEQYATAIQRYQERRFEEALQYFNRCAEMLPDDKVILLYQQRCQSLLKTEPDKSWRPIAIFIESINLIQQFKRIKSL